MIRSSVLFWTGALALGLAAMWFAAPAASEVPLQTASLRKIRNVIRRRRTRKLPLRRMRSYVRPAALPHLNRHAPCIERS